MSQPSGNTSTFYWHDYETFGTDPQRDRPVQFAGVRTDADFNIIAEPLVIYAKLAEDNLPQPDACLITGITPQLAAQKGVCEAEFIRQIHQQLAQPNTCTLGFNSLRFDDEVTRNCLYRNFYDPYTREWQNGNSRWDLIDVVRAASALRPEGIQWPVTEEGRPSFKLEHLTRANGIAHEAAHDALADVYATIAMAKLIKQTQPKLYQFLWQHRVKTEVIQLLQLGSFKPLVHISGKYPAAKQCLAVILPLCQHPTNSNGIIVYDLSVDPEPMLSLSVADIQQRLFTATDQLPEGITRIPLKTVHINKCPVLAPMSVLRPQDQQRLGIDLAQCYSHIETIKTKHDLPLILAAVFGSQAPSWQTVVDPDLAIYSGGFFSDADKQSMAKIRQLAPEQLARTPFTFNDKRLPEMLFRYRARNYPDTLNAAEQQQWRDFCTAKLTQQHSSSALTFADYFTQLQVLRDLTAVNEPIINALNDYAVDKIQWLDLPLVYENNI